MKKPLIILVILLIAIAGTISYIAFALPEPPHQDPTPFGEWGQLIEIEYMDNTIERLTSVSHDGKNVYSLHYTLSAKSQNVVDIDLSGYSIVFTVGSQDFPLTPLVTTATIGNDNQFAPIFTTEFYMAEITSLPIGNYTLYITPTGTLQFDTGNGFTTADLPSSSQVSISVYDTETLDGIGLYFDSGVIWN